MFGINGYELLALGFLGVLILGPERLPEYAAKLARGIHKVRVMAEGAKVQLKDQLGPEYEDINWRQYDPRQYDPRRIVKQALLDPIDEVVRAGQTPDEPGAAEVIAEPGYAAAPDTRTWVVGGPVPFDTEAT